MADKGEKSWLLRQDFISGLIRYPVLNGAAPFSTWRWRMQVKLNGCMVQLLLILLFPLVMVMRLFSWLSGAKKPEYVNTVAEHPLAYTGERPLVIALWTTWASVWPGTSAVIAEMKTEFADRCEFCYVEVTGNDVRKQYQTEIEPTVLVRHHGREIARFVNLMDALELREAIASCLSSKN